MSEEDFIGKQEEAETFQAAADRLKRVADDETIDPDARAFAEFMKNGMTDHAAALEKELDTSLQREADTGEKLL